jgi:hypothetical protein
MPSGLWWTRTRWFAAEYLVVVVGILTAMALQAWWQERGNRAREQVYLRQLRADLVETQRLVSGADSTHGPASLFARLSTGDLALLGDPEVRSAVTQYLELNRQLTLVQHNFGEEWRRGYAVLRSRVDLMEIVAAARSQESIDSTARANPRSALYERIDNKQ